VGAAEEETKVKVALKIAKDMLDCHEMRLSGVMHMQTDMFEYILHI
jgi:hypothetical protein